MERQSLLLLLAAVLFSAMLGATATFSSEMGSTWGDERVQILENGNLLQLALDQKSGSGYQTKNQYQFGRFDVQMKLVPGNSAGTVTAFYLQYGNNYNQIEFLFLGNVTDQPYVLQTNLYTHGQGNREQQINLWFDPRQDFHTYSLLWNQHQIVWYVDGTPIRVHINYQKYIPYPDDHPLRLFANIYSGSEWATRRGQVGIDWSRSPFQAQFRNLNIDACVVSAQDGTTSCPSSSSNWQDVQVGASSKWVRQYYIIYNYCNDPGRFPQGLPQECSINV